MADLCKSDPATEQEWNRWAIEFLRRGLWLGEYITVHGPHSPADYMWGEAEVSRDGNGWGVEAKFTTGRGSRGFYDLRGLRIFEGQGRERTTYPILSHTRLTPKARQWIKAARRRIREVQ